MCGEGIRFPNAGTGIATTGSVPGSIRCGAGADWNRSAQGGILVWIKLGRARLSATAIRRDPRVRPVSACCLG